MGNVSTKRHHLFFLICLLVLKIILTNPTQAQWIQTGPYGGVGVISLAASANNLFAGTSRGAFLSTDNGGTWSSIGLENEYIMAFAANGNNLYAGTNSTVFISTDMGVNWSSTDISQFNINSLAIGGNYVFAATHKGVLKSPNNGINWTTTNLQNIYVSSLIFEGGRLCAGTIDGFYYSYDDGVYWEPPQQPLDMNCLVKSGDTFWAGYNIYGVIVSTNSGRSWSLTKLRDVKIDALIVTGGNVLAGGRGGIYIKQGESWYIALTNTDVQAFVESNGRVFAGTPSGVFTSTNNGLEWNSCGSVGSNAKLITSLLGLDNQLLAGISNDGAYLSTNNGNSWTSTSLRNISVNAFISNSNYIFAGTSGNGIFRTSDYGTNWTSMNIDLTNNYIHSFAINGNKIYAGTREGLFRSQNNGLSWTYIGLQFNTTINSLGIIGNYLFAGTEGMGIYRSTNDGLSWTQVNYHLSNKYVRTFALEGNKIYAGTNAGTFLSTNYGDEWSTDLLFNTRFNSFITKSNYLIAGTGGDGVYFTYTSYLQWWLDNMGLTSKYVTSITISNNNLFIGTSKGVWRRPLSEMITDVEKDQNILPVHYKLSQNYPNPFNPSTRISYQIPHSGFVVLKVYDLLGREISTLVNGFKNSGKYEIEFHASNLPSGIYFYKMQSGDPSLRTGHDFSETKKFILLK